MCFHRPWLFSWFMRSVFGVVVGFLADSPAFLTRFSPPHLIFSPHAESFEARKIPSKKKSGRILLLLVVGGRFELEKAAVLFWVFLFYSER